MGSTNSYNIYHHSRYRNSMLFIEKGNTEEGEEVDFKLKS